MKEEIGKWFLDVSKYVATAVVLTLIFGEIEDKWLLFAVSFLIMASLFFIGLYYIKNKDKKKKKGKK